MRDAIYLAAMVHDIGEFVNMAHTNKDKINHSQVSYNIIKDSNIFQEELPIIKDLIINHHKPETVYEKIINAADILSCKEEQYEEDLDINIKPQLLKPIFKKIKEKTNNIKGDYVYDINPLDLKGIFPRLRDESQDIYEDYQRLYLEFIDEIKNVGKAEHLLHLLEKYLWCIPTLDIDKNHDVSMYEHAKNAAAIGLCIYDQYQSGDLTDGDLDNIEGIETDQFILINGDISGIQNFIMTVSSKGAAKSLKAHSIYLTILTDIIVRYILDNLDLKTANLLYSGGGSFFILAPKSAEYKMDKLKKEITRKILKAHSGTIFYGIDYISLSPKDFIDFPKVWQRAVEKVNQQKYQKWNELDDENKYDLIFGPFDEGTEEGEHCKLCGTGDKDSIEIKTEIDGIDLGVCGLCHSFGTITFKLRNEKYFRIEDCIIEELDKPQKYEDIFSSFGYIVDFEKENGFKKGSYYLLNDTNFLDEKCEGFKFGVYSLPRANDEWISFDQLAEQGEGDKNSLGILKLDVDNLGSIFGFGLAENKTVSKITTLSRMISLFFEGYINQIVKDMDIEKSIYVVYSGGDDTFLLGTWDKVLDLASELRKRFGDYVCNNEKITFSAGIGIFDRKYPIINSIEISESSLNRAKDFKYRNEEQATKDKVTLLGEVFNWEEYDRIHSFKELLIDTLEKAHSMNRTHIGRGLLNRILNSTLGFKGILEDSNAGKVDSLRFWKLSYFLRDIKEMDNRGNYGRQFAEEIISEYREIVLHNLVGDRKASNIRSIMIIPVATRLALMATTRDKED